MPESILPIGNTSCQAAGLRPVGMASTRPLPRTTVIGLGIYDEPPLSLMVSKPWAVKLDSARSVRRPAFPTAAVPTRSRGSTQLESDPRRRGAPSTTEASPGGRVNVLRGGPSVPRYAVQPSLA